MCRLVIPALVLFGLSFVSAATAQPDSSQSSVAPWDTYGQAFVSPGTQSGVDLVTITVADSSGNLLEGVFVEIDLSGCVSLCLDCEGLAGLIGITDANGEATLDPRVGGCEDCTIVVMANDVTIRTYSRIVSTDWDGTQADCKVDSLDLNSFMSTCASDPPGLCFDYNGSGSCGDLPDAITISLAFNAGDSHNAPHPAFSDVSPWDSYGQAFMAPGTQSGVDTVTVTVRDICGNPLANVEVEIDLSACMNLCVDSPEDGLTDTTDANGQALLDPRIGGCEDCEVRVVAGGVTLRAFSRVTSTDWDGIRGDGFVNSVDLAYFTAFPSDPCTDFNGNGGGDSGDSNLMNASVLALDKNDQVCVPTTVSEDPISYGSEPIAFVQSRPNPFRHSTEIVLVAGQRLEQVTVTIFDIAGRRVWSRALGELPPGSYTFSWRGENEAGRPVAAGTYFYLIEHRSGRSEPHRLTLLR